MILLILIVGVGIGLVGYGQFVMPKPGAYLYVAEQPTNQSEFDRGAPVVEYEDLSPAVQRKFTQRLKGQTKYLGPTADARNAFPWGANEVGYVRYQEAYYESGVTIRHPTKVPQKWVVLIGGILTVIGIAGVIRLRYINSHD